MLKEHPIKLGKPSKKCFTKTFRAQKQTAQTSIQATNTTVDRKFSFKRKQNAAVAEQFSSK